MPEDPETHLTLGFAFVEYSSPQARASSSSTILEKQSTLAMHSNLR